MCKSNMLMIPKLPQDNITKEHNKSTKYALKVHIIIYIIKIALKSVFIP